MMTTSRCLPLLVATVAVLLSTSTGQRNNGCESVCAQNYDYTALLEQNACKEACNLLRMLRVAEQNANFVHIQNTCTSNCAEGFVQSPLRMACAKGCLSQPDLKGDSQFQARLSSSSPLFRFGKKAMAAIQKQQQKAFKQQFMRNVFERTAPRFEFPKMVKLPELPAPQPLRNSAFFKRDPFDDPFFNNAPPAKTRFENPDKVPSMPQIFRRRHQFAFENHERQLERAAKRLNEMRRLMDQLLGRTRLTAVAEGQSVRSDEFGGDTDSEQIPAALPQQVEESFDSFEDEQPLHQIEETKQNPIFLIKINPIEEKKTESSETFPVERPAEQSSRDSWLRCLKRKTEQLTFIGRSLLCLALLLCTFTMLWLCMSVVRTAPKRRLVMMTTTANPQTQTLGKAENIYVISPVREKVVEEKEEPVYSSPVHKVPPPPYKSDKEASEAAK